MSKNWEGNKEIQIFREYLRIPSVHPNPNYEPCVEFLKRQAQDLELEVKVYHPVNDKNPIVVLSLIGKDPSLPTILLNSHMDVVPVVPDQWTYPAFDAHMDDQGRIFARGSQDMKSVGTQYLGALRALKKSGTSFKRTIHVVFVPDEELGSYYGMRKFVHTEDFKRLNVGFALDEGMSGISDTFKLFYAEKSAWQIEFKCSGPPGHGSALLENTAGEKVSFILSKMMDLRRKEIAKIDETKKYEGMGTSINVTKLSGGLQNNVIPSLLSVTFDLRLDINEDHEALLKQFQDWCEEAGGSIEMVFERKDKKTPATKLDNSNIFWVAFEKATEELGIKVQPIVCPAATDSSFMRDVGVPSIGFSPINNTPILIHGHNEFIYAENYLKGIEIYQKIITNVANC
ncbi:aminoacylase-1-like [Phlebotomus papatasi]|uniref:aminoacylase-1-like n=1 Tax=Phlebotomus papatasi TaxID=29031 RepID=UPI002483D997|nr:aminoacylase-1-like [Phlebotomus papatasi]